MKATDVTHSSRQEGIAASELTGKPLAAFLQGNLIRRVVCPSHIASVDERPTDIHVHSHPIGGIDAAQRTLIDCAVEGARFLQRRISLGRIERFACCTLGKGKGEVAANSPSLRFRTIVALIGKSRDRREGRRHCQHKYQSEQSTKQAASSRRDSGATRNGRARHFFPLSIPLCPRPPSQAEQVNITPPAAPLARLRADSAPYGGLFEPAA